MIRTLTIDELIHYVPRLSEARAQLGRTRPMNEERFLQKWMSWYATGNGVVFGFFVDGTLGGTLGALLSTDLYDDTPITVEVFLNIRPEAKMRAGWRKLISAYVTWAKSHGATEIYLSRWASCPKIDALYAKMGFLESEVHYRLATWKG